MDRGARGRQRRRKSIRVQRPKQLGTGRRRGRVEQMLEDLNEASRVLSEQGTPVLREDSFGNRNEFFDDHQRWMIESYDPL